MFKVDIQPREFVVSHGKMMADFESLKIPDSVKRNGVEKVHGETLVNCSQENVLFVFFVNVVRNDNVGLALEAFVLLVEVNGMEVCGVFYFGFFGVFGGSEVT